MKLTKAAQRLEEKGCLIVLFQGLHLNYCSTKQLEETLLIFFAEWICLKMFVVRSQQSDFLLSSSLLFFSESGMREYALDFINLLTKILSKSVCLHKMSQRM